MYEVNEYHVIKIWTERHRTERNNLTESSELAPRQIIDSTDWL